MSDSDFIRDRIRADIDKGTHGGRTRTRFPPEPNGFLHIGHAKSICLNFAVAAEVGGTTNLRMDDTNPLTENADFVRGIEDDLAWLGFSPAGETRYTSDYFEQLYEWAELLITKGLAYVDDQDGDAISKNRGSFTEPGENSPFRDRSPEENLDLFRRMRTGEFADGEKVLRAKIDMAHGNMQMRDPILYRIINAPHYRTGTEWSIYPTYDWAHGQSDAIEGITHSLCTLEFDTHRELYEWCLAQLDLPSAPPEQIEFARLDLTHTVLSKRNLAELVESGAVDGWDDPRMPTLRGLRRRGYPAAAIREFCDHIGVARFNGTHEIELLESFVRTDLNRNAVRRMGVLHPLKVVIENYPENESEDREAINNPEDRSAGVRAVPFSRVLYIEREDFMEDPPKKFFRLSVGREVRLRYGYFITCTDVVKNDAGDVIELRATYDPETGGGQAPDGRKVKATLHWVSAAHAVDATVVLYDRLYDAAGELNASSREILHGVKVEPALADTPPGGHVQFERLGYFAADSDTPLLFHRTVGLRDEWARIQARKTAP